MQIIYKTLYHPQINYLLRNSLSLFKPILPPSFKIPVSGTLHIPIDEKNSIKLATNQTNSLCKLVFWGKRNQHEYTPLFLDLIPKMKVFLDIGASIGYYSMLAAKLNPEIQVHAFEAASGPFHYLQKNIELNQLKNVQAHELAVSDQDGSITFYAPFNPKYSYLKHHLGGNGSTNEAAAGGNMNSTTVPTFKLDTLVGQLNLDRIDLIKMDTEATEHFVLRGGIESIKKHQPIIISEVLFHQIEHLLEPIIAELGYDAYKHTDEGLIYTEKITRDDDDGVRNFFFVPPSKRKVISA